MFFYPLFQKYAPVIDSNQVLSKEELITQVDPWDKWLLLKLPFTVVRKVNGQVRWE